MRITTKNYNISIYDSILLTRCFKNISIDIKKFNWFKPIIIENQVFDRTVYIAYFSKPKIFENKKVIFRNCVFETHIIYLAGISEYIHYENCVKLE